MDEQNITIGIESAKATNDLPLPCNRDFYRDEDNRVFYVDDVINEETLELSKFIMECNRADRGIDVEDRKPITVMIDSPGGSVEVLNSLMGAIKISKTPVHTVVLCAAYSAAADLLAMGHKRFALPNTCIMAHAGSCAYQGTQDQVESAKKFFDAVGKRITNQVQARCGYDTKVAKKIKTGDFYMTEEEALTYGFIDRIIEDFDEIFN